MKKTLFILIVICAFAIQVNAQYVRVNYDKKTIAAMVGAYGAETVAEVYYNAVSYTHLTLPTNSLV